MAKSEPLTCAFGSIWPHGCGPCRKCVAEADRLERAFWQGVFFGEYVNERGYKSHEWAARCARIAERDGAANTNRAPHQPSRMEATEHG